MKKKGLGVNIGTKKGANGVTKGEARGVVKEAKENQEGQSKAKEGEKPYNVGVVGRPVSFDFQPS